MNIKCVVTCLNASGVPDLHPVLVTCTQEQYDEGEHYEHAKDNATLDGYENCGLVYDENDYPKLIKLFNFNGQTNAIDIVGEA